MDPLIFILMLVTPMIPWCLWPKRGTRSRAALTGYRWGFTPLAILPLGLILWMLMLFFLEPGAAIVAAIGAFYGFIGVWISAVVGVIAAIVCGVRHKSPSSAKCENCGYLLRGLPTDRCPECGQRRGGSDELGI